MEPRIIYKPAFTVVGFSDDGSHQEDGNRDRLWERLGDRFNEIPHADPDIGFGIHFFIDSKENYLAGLSASSDSVLPPGMKSLRINTHAYAVFTHFGPVNQINETLQRVFADWLPASGYRVAGDFYFEYYDDRFQPYSEDSLLFIYVPVQPSD